MFWKKKPKAPPALLTLGNDPLTVHSGYEGYWISGSIGSGKTSGPTEALCRAWLAEGAGFCVLTAKPGEYERWVRLCAEMGRSRDLIRFAPGVGWKCDLLNY